MVIITLTYTARLDAIDEALPQHASWLAQQYDAGLFLASGRRAPRTGGVILASDMPVKEAEALAATDPFAILGLAHHDVVRFRPGRVDDALVGTRWAR